MKFVGTKLVGTVAERWKALCHRRYLKKMGWTEAAYQKQTDPLHNMRASRISDYYHGYKHIHMFDSTQVSPFIGDKHWIEVYGNINAWCLTNCQGRWREDIHRVYKQTGLGVDGKEYPEYFLNDLSGSDYLFYAFENSKDYTLFCLRWS
jgi:hypothetical protein